MHFATTKPLGIVITDFNGWPRTRKCLAALQASDFKDFYVLLVDHGTSDETKNGLERDYPDVSRTKGNPDQWWSGATNAGIRRVLSLGTPYVMLLNNDCYVSPGTLGQLMRHANTHPGSIIAPAQRDVASGRYISIAPRTNLLLGFATVGGPKRITRRMRQKGLIKTRLIVGGRGALVPAHIFSRVGFLDEQNLPHYCADHDFFLRCRKAGIPLLAAVDSDVLVDGTQTSVALSSETRGFGGLVEDLTSMRSHRSVRHLVPFFRKHYPVPALHLVGVAMYVLRYILVSGFAHLRKHLLSRSPSGRPSL